jgi:formylglycine-generating enzyme required for sulfatase activity
VGVEEAENPLTLILVVSSSFEVNLRIFFIALYLFLLQSLIGTTRIITSSTGVKIEAEILSVDDDGVRIKRLSDNIPFKIPFSLLSEADRIFFKLDGTDAKPSGVTQGAPPPSLGKPYKIPAFEIEMLWCPPGTFNMGSKSEKKVQKDDIFGIRAPMNQTPLRIVQLTQGFWLGKRAVTQTQWVRLMKTNPSKHNGPNIPVSNVSLEEVKMFCFKLSQSESRAGRLPRGYAYQLPSEAQWDYACRAGSNQPMSGAQILHDFDGTELVLPSNDAGPFARPSRVHDDNSSNSWGFYNMSGNVIEMCFDKYSSWTGSTAKDPVVRSGVGRTSLGNVYVVRYGFARGWIEKVHKWQNLGFRLSLGPRL